MNENRGDAKSLATKLERAYSTGDLEKVAPLFAEDIRWGDKELPWKCRGRSEVLATFSRFMARGVTADVTEMKTGTKGVLVGLRVRWPDQATNHDRVLFHVYLVQDDEIAEIQRYDDRRCAARAAGVAG
jgi:ketosteroid isomerase-like protein